MSRDTLSNKLWSACNIMRQDAGTTGALQYIEQFSWILFLKVYEEIENEHEAKAAFENKKYERNLDGKYSWSKWTDKDKYLTGPDLKAFIEKELLPHLRGLAGSQQKELIAEIFRNVQNRMEDGYKIREVIDIIAGIDFFKTEDVHAVSLIYEDLLARMGNESGLAGEFYTPRPIIRFMVEMVDPQINETVYDPAAGSAGFLVESYKHMKEQEKSVKDREKLQTETFYAREAKPLPYVLGMMNMILHGIQIPNLYKGDTLAINLFTISEADRYNVVLTNPPFGGSLRGVEANFPYPSRSTEILFLQHAIRSLKRKGRCGIIFPEGVLFKNDEQAYVNTKKELLENFNLHRIVRLPNGAFAPYTNIPTNLLFFDKTEPTKEIWYYQLPLPEGRKSFTKTRPIKAEHFEECKELWDKRKITERSWIVKIDQVIKRNYNLDFKNPNKKADFEHLPPEKLIEKIIESEKKIHKTLGEIKKIL